MATSQINKLRENERARRIGTAYADDDSAVMSLGAIPPPQTQDDPYSVGVPNIPDEDPSFVRNDIGGIDSRISSSVGDEPADRYKKWLDDYQPEHQATDRLNSLVSNPPQRERPSLGRTLVAAGIGMGKGGLQDAQTVMNEPWERKKDEWTTQTGPAYQAASIERQTNANERALRGNVLSAEVAADRMASTERIASERNETTRKRNEDLARIADKKNELLAEKQHGVKYYEVGNKLYGTYEDGTSFDTGMVNTDFSPMELARLKHQNTMAEIGKRTEGAVEVKEATPGGYAGRSANNGAGSPSGETPQATHIRQANIAHQLLAGDSELGEFIKITGSNDFTMTPPKPGWFSSITPEKQAKYANAYKAIYGVDLPTGLSPSAKVATPPPTPAKTTGLGPTVTPEAAPNRVDDISAQRARAANRSKFGPDVGPGLPQSDYDSPVMGSKPLGTKVQQMQRIRAADILRNSVPPKPVTDANIDALIESGLVP
jgi:hypothetical protein